MAHMKKANRGQSSQLSLGQVRRDELTLGGGFFKDGIMKTIGIIGLIWDLCRDSRVYRLM